jgi:hypothetical protein
MSNSLSMIIPARGSSRALIAVLLALFVSLPILGQTVSVDWPLRVRNEAGEPIARAQVTVTNEQTKQRQTQETDQTGLALFKGLAPGRYKVRVEKRGFEAFLRENVPIGIEKAQGLEVEMASAQRLLLISPIETVTAAVASPSVTTATREDFSALPNLNNDLTPILEVVPGAVATGPSTLGRVIIDGKGKDQQITRIDGLDVAPMVELPAGDPSVGILDGFLKPSVALDKASPIAGAFESRLGPSTGTIVDGTTLSGVVNKDWKKPWKAQIYDKLLNDALNARNFFDYEGNNAIRRNMFGGKFGGQLVPRRAFLFAAYEGIRGRTEQNLYEAVPTDALCGCGALASLVGQFLAPGTTIVPGASLNPDFLVARRHAHTSSKANAFDVRFDWTPSAGAIVAGTSDLAPRAEDVITFRVTHQMSDALLPDGITGRNQRQRLDLTHVVASMHLRTQNYSHDFRFGINRTRGRIDVELSPETATDLSRSLITLAGTVNTAGLPGDIPSVPVATLGGLVKGVGRGFDLNPVSYITAYDFTRRFRGGDHELRFGVETRLIHLSFDRLGGLTYAFPNGAALRTGTPGSVTFLLDLSGPSPFTGGAGPRHARQQYYTGYFQVVSKFFKSAPRRTSSGAEVPPKLTLNYGLRYDYFGAVRERNGRAVIIDPQTGQFMEPGTPFYRASKLNFEPRFGLEYRPAVESGLLANTAFNIGAGIYLGVPRIGDLLLPIESDRVATGVTGGTFPATPEDVTQSFITNPETRQFQPLAFARDFSTPERVYKWDAKYTRRFGGIYDFSMGYSGNVGRNLPLAGIANQIVRVETNPDPTKPAIVIRQFDIIRAGQVFKPFGEFFYRTSDGRSSYNGMTIALSRARDKTVDNDKIKLPTWLVPNKFTIQYTLSRSVGNVSGTVASDPSSFLPDFGYNASDARHSFSFQTIYKIDEAKKFEGIKSKFLSGWTIAPTVTARSGQPLIIRLERPDVVYLDGAGYVFSSPAPGRRAVINTPGGGASGGSRIPDLLPGVNPYLRNELELLNPAAFTIPAPGTFGNLRRGALRGPGSFKIDLAVTRHFLSLEKNKGITADFKVEFFNLLNRTNFLNPTATLPNVLGTNAADNQLQPGAPFSRKAASLFGIFNAADASRQIQFTLTLNLNEGF